VGFSATLDYRGSEPPCEAEAVLLVVDGERSAICRFNAPSVLDRQSKWMHVKRNKLNEVASRIACPECREALEAPDLGAFECRNCGAEYSRSESSIDLLPKKMRDKFRLVETENVSAHPYPNEAQAIFRKVAASGGFTLDMGAGDQAITDPSIICSEIVAYPATDVIAVGQRLPFRDAVFDAVYSNAVLEHVTDPFVCAEELHRVLKPGGLIFCSVPFLQPEHGYPHHYYNMTQDGLTNLFTRLGARLLSRSTPNWGHPIIALHWIINETKPHGKNDCCRFLQDWKEQLRSTGKQAVG
jgi:SAM-dependent methyltransferase